MVKPSKNNATILVPRKRGYPVDNSVTEEPKTLSDNPVKIKRARLNTSGFGNANLTDPSSTPSLDSGQKTLLLGMIRQRLTELDNRTLYVRKLPRNTTLAQLKVLCPTSINARIQSNKFANRRKHAFIEFKNKEMAQSALRSADGKLIGDRPIRAELCSDRLATCKTANTSDVEKPLTPHWLPPHRRQLNEFSLTALHVSCIPRSATQDEVRELFKKADNFDFHMNHKQKGIGSCRITFRSEEDALEAFKAMHGTLLRECPLIVNFAFRKHKPREPKRREDSGPVNQGLVANSVRTAKSVPGEMVLTEQPKRHPHPHNSASESHIDRPAKKRKDVKKQKSVNEPLIVATYCAPLGSNVVQEGKKLKKVPGSVAPPTPKKLHQHQKSGKVKPNT